MSKFFLSLVAALAVLSSPLHAFWITNDAGWGTPFGYYFSLLDWHGGAIVARIVGPASKAGLMMRANLAPSSPLVMLNTRADGSVEFVSRTLSGAVTSLTPPLVTPPTWLKLVSAGGTRIEGWVSTNGTLWQMIGAVQVPTSPVWVGLATPANMTPGSLFDSVTVTADAPAPPVVLPPAAPSLFHAQP